MRIWSVVVLAPRLSVGGMEATNPSTGSAKTRFDPGAHSRRHAFRCGAPEAAGMYSMWKRKRDRFTRVTGRRSRPS